MQEQFHRFIKFWNSPFGPVCTFSIVLVFFDALILDITFVTFFLLLLGASPWLLNFLEEMEFPGGFKIKTKDLEKIAERAKEDGLYKTESSLPEGPLYYQIYNEDPNLALAGLRIEIEKKIIKLAEISGLISTETQALRRSPIYKLSQELSKKGLLSAPEAALLADLMPLLNRAVHGANVDKEASDWVIDHGSKIVAALEEKLQQIQKN